MKYLINIEEKKVKNKEIQPTFCNIISTKEGTITKIITKKGTPIKEVNEHINKGDVLISGEITYNNETKGVTCAEGQVFANTWYTISLKIPKTYEKVIKNKEYTKHIIFKYKNKSKKIGRSKYSNPIVENKKILKLPGLEIIFSKEYKTTVSKLEYTEIELENQVNQLIKQKLKPFLINSNKLIKQNVLKKSDFNSTIDIELFIILEEEISLQNIELETDVLQ